MNTSAGDLVPRIVHLLNPSFWVVKTKDPTNEIGVDKDYKDKASRTCEVIISTLKL